MTFVEYLEALIDKKSEQFQTFCEVTCNSTVEEVRKKLSSPRVPFSLVLRMLNDMGEECYLGSADEDVSYRIEGRTKKSGRAKKSADAKFDDFMSFADCCLVPTGNSSSRVLREDLYICYLNWCDLSGKAPHSDKLLYKWMRENFLGLDNENESVEFQNSARKRGFKGVDIKDESEWVFEEDE